MTKFRVTTPVADFNGQIAGVHFRDGVAEVDAPAPLPRLPEGKALSRDERAKREQVVNDPGYRAMAYFRAQGYGVEQVDSRAAGKAAKATEDKPPADPNAPVMPAKNASTEAWQAYAVARGMDPAEAAEAKHADLVKLYTEENQP